MPEEKGRKLASEERCGVALITGTDSRQIMDIMRIKRSLRQNEDFGTHKSEEPSETILVWRGNGYIGKSGEFLSLKMFPLFIEQVNWLTVTIFSARKKNRTTFL